MAADFLIVPDELKPDDGNGDDDAYNRGWNACRDHVLAALRAEAGALGDEDEFAVKVLSAFLVDWNETPDSHKTALTGFMRAALAQARRTDRE